MSSLTLSASRLTLDDLVKEAERLGNLRVYTKTEGWSDAGRRKGYKVELFCAKGRSEINIKIENGSLSWAIAEAINEARLMGVGECE